MSEILVNTIKKADGTGSITVPAETGTVVIKDGSNDVTLNDITAGGIYLGGTGAANHLDDYEEGTWTPEFASDSGTDPTCTYDNIQFGYYQRVGDWVHCTGGLRTDSVSGGSLNLAIKGLPFAGESTTTSGTTCRQAGTIGQAYAWSGNAPYKLDRARAYPSIADQLDQIYHEGIDAWKETIAAVKAEYPKP